MTTAERQEAARVMATMLREGYATVAQLIESTLNDPLNPPPAPLPCPNCHRDTVRPFGDEDGEWMLCGWCSARWTPAYRAPCPTCAELRYTQRQRDDWENAMAKMQARAEAAEKLVAELRAELGERDQRRDMYPIETAGQELREMKARTLAAERLCVQAAAVLRKFPRGPLTAFEIINRARNILEGRPSA